MPVPKRKRSKSRRDKRFANKAMKIQAITSCANCKNALMPHSACRQCGFYKGTKVMTGKLDRQAKRVEVRKAKEARKQGAAPVQAEPSGEKE